MFLGEMLCIIPAILQHYHSRRRLHKTASAYTLVTQDDHSDQRSSELIDDRTPLHPKVEPPPLTGIAMGWLLFPALCDILGTTLMNVGLILVPVSIYQMSRGALVLWVGVLSVIFLSRKLRAYQWASLIIVVIGVAIVGLSGSLVKKAASTDGEVIHEVVKRMGVVLKRAFEGKQVERALRVEDDDPAKVAVGVLLILFAQVFTASQFVSTQLGWMRCTYPNVELKHDVTQVIEEKIMTWYSVEPLVGTRRHRCPLTSNNRSSPLQLAVGLEGIFGFSTIIIAMPFLHKFLAHSSPYFDIPRGFHQTVDNKTVIMLSGVICISIACFNVFGLSVTRAVSAAAR